MKANPNEKKSAVSIIIFMIIFVLVAVIFTFWFFFQPQDELIELPPVDFSVTSSDGSQITNVTARFTISSDGNDLKIKSKDEINADIIEAMKDIDFNALSEDNGMEYVKATVKEKLSEKYPNQIKEVYLSDFINDVSIPEKNNQDNYDNSTRNETMKGLFKKMQ